MTLSWSAKCARRSSNTSCERAKGTLLTSAALTISKGECQIKLQSDPVFYVCRRRYIKVLRSKSSQHRSNTVTLFKSFPFAAGTIEVFGKFTWIDQVEASLLNLNQARVDEREDLSASIGYYTDNWSISMFGRNLTDDRFEVFQPIATLFAAGIVNRPRSVGLEFTYEI